MPASELTLANRLFELRNAERELRGRLWVSPSYWAADLTELSKLHRQVADEYGSYLENERWLGLDFLDWDRALAVAELSRHCFTQPKFQRQCLVSLEQAARFGGAAEEWFATLYDTIMFFESKPQSFGTFYDWSGSGEWAPWTIKDPKNLATRRAAFRLPTPGQKVETSLLPPSNYRVYRDDFETWRRSVGWTKSD